jgi:hypothetical protein
MATTKSAAVAHEATPVTGVGQTAADKRAEADRRFEAARRRWLSIENNQKLLSELAKH